MNLSRAQILKMSFTVVATLEHKTAKILAQQVRKLFLSEFLLIVAEPRLRLTNIQRWPIEIFLSVLELARWQILRSKKSVNLGWIVKIFRVVQKNRNFDLV